jgi:hypothetical protein
MSYKKFISALADMIILAILALVTLIPAADLPGRIAALFAHPAQSETATATATAADADAAMPAE